MLEPSYQIVSDGSKITTINAACVCATKINDALRLNYKMWFPGNVEKDMITGEMRILPKPDFHPPLSKALLKLKKRMQNAYVLLNKLRGECLVTLRGHPLKERMRLVNIEEEIKHRHFLKRKEEKVEEEEEEEGEECDDPVSFVRFETGIPLNRGGMTKIRIILTNVIEVLGTPEEFRNHFLRENKRSVIPYQKNWPEIKTKAFERYKKVYEKTLRVTIK